MIDYVIEKIGLNVYDVILLCDRDGILLEESVAGEINKSGYEIIEYQDPDMFRYYYERNVRSVIDSGSMPDKKLIIRYDKRHILPYDIQKACYNASISLSDIFPKLSYDVLKELGSDIYKNIFEAYKTYNGRRLGDRDTMNFVLRYVYGIVPELINNFTALVKLFISLYYKQMELPEILGRYLCDVLSDKNSLEGYPINEVILSKESFFKFLQKQWELYVQDLLNNTRNSIIDFSDQDIKAYMDNLFTEKYLEPVKVDGIDGLPVWVRAGIVYDEIDRLRKDYDGLLDKINDSVKSVKSFKDWFNIASMWAEALLIYHRVDVDLKLDKEKFAYTGQVLDNSFNRWLLDNYRYLTSLSYVRSPVMVHHIPWHINYKMRKMSYNKFALIVMDGMSLDDWYVIRDYLKQVDDWTMESALSFAWIPTITSVSRQALFSGEVPVYFKDTLFSTNSDAVHWKRFWLNQGLNSDSVFYMRNIFDFSEEGLSDIIDNRRAKAVGLVVNIIDRIMHGQQLSVEGMHQDIRLWLKKGYFERFLKELQSKGYEIFIASDHGNISSVGQGKAQGGIFVEKAAERVVVYDSGYDYGKAVDGYRSFKWPGFGLPEDYSYLICDDRYTYSAQGERAISHGGTSIQEVIVPFIHIRRED
ncbi:BREX-3 system phosphatase PglZ [Caldanaerobius polysaccharolyticus]|uniref:BREX-3 system phosphatase PglZ n=1 Tax=Caldanaerobius polysaccharolyticus TaxID=44256 RepID=UPI00047881D7|nr:BREX-3 system phosphatase PglZ [Caldanaerobius polysaccharolyticus]